ncbi:hypothetical protein CGCA056_v010726 [Colletotrichum aenigma]|uniref:uncharacterized protein n=1 Tax=Colletotrichum aenigma TaxID=1215731 RepID=UPI001872E1A8|nr:uncharacterized protein CGCA056_v010726 [Colletotrichum aenigma]KAF5518284.1 hypothetical protein CGCA056_v010726 [Colletotrichum aenigma]
MAHPWFMVLLAEQTGDEECGKRRCLSGTHRRLPTWTSGTRNTETGVAPAPTWDWAVPLTPHAVPGGQGNRERRGLPYLTNSFGRMTTRPVRFSGVCGSAALLHSPNPIPTPCFPASASMSSPQTVASLPLMTAGHPLPTSSTHAHNTKRGHHNHSLLALLCLRLASSPSLLNYRRSSTVIAHQVAPLACGELFLALLIPLGMPRKKDALHRLTAPCLPA